MNMTRSDSVLANLGRVVYNYELKRERSYLPDLSRYQVFD